MSQNQWLALVVSVWLIITVVAEVVMALDTPWGERTPGYDPPPIFGGMVIGALAIVALAVPAGIGYGIFWLWTH